MSSNLERIIFSTSDEYADFWPINSKIWKEHIGIEPICIHFGEKTLTEKYGQVIKYNYLKDLPPILQVTWSKFRLPELFNGYTIIGDIDQIPLNREYFLRNYSRYTHLNAFGCDLTTEVWNNKGSLIMGGADLPGHYHVAIGEDYRKYYSDNKSFEEQINIFSETKSYGLGKISNDWNNPEKYFWCLEEMYTSHMLKINNVNIDMYNKANRICRSEWQNNMYLYDKDVANIDIHCMRPYKEYEQQLFKVLEDYEIDCTSL